jgi:hypothetical protein
MFQAFALYRVAVFVREFDAMHGEKLKSQTAGS